MAQSVGMRNCSLITTQKANGSAGPRSYLDELLVKNNSAVKSWSQLLPGRGVAAGRRLGPYGTLTDTHPQSCRTPLLVKHASFTSCEMIHTHNQWCSNAAARCSDVELQESQRSCSCRRLLSPSTAATW